MRSKITIKSISFKALMIVLFSAFFFVQLQAAFIACTNYDSSSGISSTSITGGSQLLSNKATTGSVAKFKLNKRFQSVSPFVLARIEEPTPNFSVIQSEAWISPRFVIVSQFLQSDRLRGPPHFNQL